MWYEFIILFKISIEVFHVNNTELNNIYKSLQMNVSALPSGSQLQML